MSVDLNICRIWLVFACLGQVLEL